jgi:hypothetical protein
LLGDLPSPVLVGQVMQSVRLTYFPGLTAEGEVRHTGDRYVIAGLCLIMVVCACFWALSAVLYARQFRPLASDVLLGDGQSGGDVPRDDDGVVQLADETDEHTQ